MIANDVVQLIPHPETDVIYLDEKCIECEFLHSNSCVIVEKRESTDGKCSSFLENISPYERVKAIGYCPECNYPVFHNKECEQCKEIEEERIKKEVAENLEAIKKEEEYERDKKDRADREERTQKREEKERKLKAKYYNLKIESGFININNSMIPIDEIQAVNFNYHDGITFSFKTIKSTLSYRPQISDMYGSDDPVLHLMDYFYTKIVPQLSNKKIYMKTKEK